LSFFFLATINPTLQQNYMSATWVRRGCLMSYMRTNEILLKKKHGYYCHICDIRISLSTIQENSCFGKY
jgi:hypothetical protein